MFTENPLRMYMRYHGSKDQRELDIQLLDDFRKRFLYYSEGLNYLFGGFQFEIGKKAPNVQTPSNKDIFYDSIKIRGSDPLDREYHAITNLKECTERVLPFCIIPTETVDPQLAEKPGMKYLLQTNRGHSSQRSKYTTVDKGLAILLENNQFPIIFSRDMMNYSDQSPAIKLRAIDVKKLEVPGFVAPQLVKQIISNALSDNNPRKNQLLEEKMNWIREELGVRIT